MVFQTEVEFSLPKGYIDSEGVLHRQGVMRLATAADEILPFKDARVQQNSAYLTIVVLSRVIIRLGALTDVNTKTIEGLFASDLNYLQNLYEKINASDDDVIDQSMAASSPNDGRPGGLNIVGER